MNKKGLITVTSFLCILVFTEGIKFKYQQLKHSHALAPESDTVCEHLDTKQQAFNEVGLQQFFTIMGDNVTVTEWEVS